MPGPRREDAGVILMGVVVLVALLAIGATALGVIYLRQLNQQRQVQTQASLEQALHGMFPGFRAKGATMYADFGYRPAVPAGPPPTYFYDLKGMTTLTSVTTSTGTANPSLFTGVMSPTPPYLSGWNGPYWTGTVDSANRPVDAWGRPLQLRHISTSATPGWQVFSLGANGVSETGDTQTPGGDDLVYPVPPYVLPSSTAVCATPTVNWNRNGLFPPAAETVTITLSWSGGTQAVTTSFTNGNPGGNPPPVFTNLPVGVTITVTFVSNRRTIAPTTFVIPSSATCTASPNPISF